MSTLVAEAAPGVLIDIFDAYFRPVATGIQYLERTLEEGLYTVRFTAAGRSEDKVVRLLPIEQPLVVRGGDLALPSASPSQATDASATEITQAKAVEEIGRKLKPWHPHGQELLVFVRAPDDRTRVDVARSLRLVDGADTSMRSDLVPGEDERMTDAAQGWAARRYSLEAGCYSLQYKALSRRKVEQTTFAWPGRRTFTFLEYGAAAQIEQSGDGFRHVSRRGVDPTRTVMVSAPEGAPVPDAEVLRLADILLHALREPSSTLDPAVVRNLLAGTDCPFLFLYAAAALTCRLELAQDVLVAARGSESVPAHSANGAPSEIKDQVLELLDRMPPGGWPDAHCIRWRISELGNGASDKGVLSALPLFNCSWRWASAYSVGHPNALPATGKFSAAAQDRERAAPWLAWRPAAALHTTSLSRPYSEHQLSPAIYSVASSIGLTERPYASDPREEFEQIKRSDELFVTLSPETQQTANAVKALVASSGMRDIDPRALASLLGAPAQALGARLERAATELAGKAVKF